MDLLKMYVINEDEERLDSYLARELEDLSRTYIHWLKKD